jgi:hypothetical protein
MLTAKQFEGHEWINPEFGKFLCPGLQEIRKSIALFESFQASPYYPSDKSSIKMKMSMQYRCVDINKKKLKLWEKCHFVQQNLHMD